MTTHDHKAGEVLGEVGGKVLVVMAMPKVAGYEYTGEYRQPNVGDRFLANNDFEKGEVMIRDSGVHFNDRWILRQVAPEMHKYCPYCGAIADGRTYMCDECWNWGGEVGGDAYVAKGHDISPIDPSATPPAILLPKPWLQKPKAHSVTAKPGDTVKINVDGKAVTVEIAQ